MAFATFTWRVAGGNQRRAATGSTGRLTTANGRERGCFEEATADVDPIGAEIHPKPEFCRASETIVGKQCAAHRMSCPLTLVPLVVARSRIDQQAVGPGHQDAMPLRQAGIVNLNVAILPATDHGDVTA